MVSIILKNSIIKKKKLFDLKVNSEINIYIFFLTIEILLINLRKLLKFKH